MRLGVYIQTTAERRLNTLIIQHNGSRPNQCHNFSPYCQFPNISSSK